MENFHQRQIAIPSILKIGKNEIDHIGQYLLEAGFTNVACFFSAGIEELYGEKVFESLENQGINIVHKDIIDQTHIENVIDTAFSIPKSVNVLLGIGGGKALDYSKYCAHILALPFISVPTSTSNDGFCAPNASLLVNNKRKTIKATIPYGVIVDLTAVKNAPDICVYSGIGDLISKITAGRDWKMACSLSKAQFNDFAYLISQNSVLELLNYQDWDIKSLKFLYQLVYSLLMNGIAMEIASSSRPASGSEHLISHAYDSITHKPSMHGIQVGLATYICSYLQDYEFEKIKNLLIHTGFFDFLEKHPLNKQEFIQAIRKAPSIKEMFYTILSVPENIDKAVDFVENDPICKKTLV